VINEQKHYETVDMPFYKENIEPRIPESILDFHTHVWHPSHFKINPLKDSQKGSNYVVVHRPEYTFSSLLKDANKIFPGKKYKAVCFGIPNPSSEPIITNEYVSKGAKSIPSMFPLMIAGNGLFSAEELEKTIIEGGFFGYKVFLNWLGDDYGDITIEDMLSPVEMKIADKYNLIVLIHVPRSDRLANPIIQQGIRNLAENYPNAQIVLAHCGRCYLPDQMKLAAFSIRDLPNVNLDSSMVMDPTALEILLENIDSKRLLFATDFPIPSMRGRRVYVADHWVDLVLEGYPESSYRVQSDNMKASFMAYEIVLALIRAAERMKLGKKEIQGIFHDNGMNIINKVAIPDSK